MGHRGALNSGGGGRVWLGAWLVAVGGISCNADGQGSALPGCNMDGDCGTGFACVDHACTPSRALDGGGGGDLPGSANAVTFNVVESASAGGVQKPKVDILFMVDNSNSMDAMQTELKNRFGDFFKPFVGLAAPTDPSVLPVYADLHIGVVTSDFGAGATGAPGCTPSGLAGGGDQGKLQAKGKYADPACQKPVGANFVEYAFGPGGGAASTNLPVGQNLLTTFSCMASVGSSGCGFEAQLESVYAALHNNIPENQGFLRDDALLVVVFLTNEDDASAPPDTDVFDKTKVAQYGYEDSYSRQTRFAVMCGDPPTFPPYGDSGGALTNCQPAPNLDGESGPGKQYDVNRYINFFTLPTAQGGVKFNPLDVVLVGIDAPASPFQVLLSNPGTQAGRPYVQCAQLDENSNPPCVPVLQHSCVGTNSAFVGDPAVRLNAVISSVKQHQITSICDSDYTPALQGAADLLVGAVIPGCVPTKLPRDAGGNLKLGCTVTEQVLQADGTTSAIPVPACDAAHSFEPCFTMSPSPRCQAISPDGVAVTVDHGATNGMPNPPPPHAALLVSCPR